MRAESDEIEALRREIERLRVLSTDHSGLLEAVLAHSPHGILVCDREGRIYLQNRAAERIWAGSATTNDTEGWGRYRAFHPDGRPYEPRDWAMARCLATGAVMEAEEVHFQRFDGTHGTMLGSCAPIYRADGTIDGALSVFADITRFKETEASERRARAEAEAARRRAMFLADASDLLGASFDVSANLGAVAELAAKSLADACRIVLQSPKHATDVRVANGDAAVLDEISDETRAEVSAACTGRILTAGDRSAIAVPIVARGAALGTIALIGRAGERFAADDLVTAEQLGRRAGVAIDNALLYENARDAIRTREQILGIVSHDLRNPVTAIAANAFSLSRHATDPRVRQKGDSIQRTAKRMTRMINDLLDLAMVAEGKLSIHRKRIGVDALIADTIEPFVADAEARSVKLEVQSAPELAVDCDADRIVQVLSNLLANALKATPAGGAVFLRVASRDGHVLFEVEDTGPGIAPRDMPQIFEPFYRGAAIDVRGGGLGLSIAKALVEAHDGTIAADSRVGAGSRFYFTVPLR